MISKDYRVIWTNSVLKDLFGPVVGRVCYSAFNQSSEICPDCGVHKVFNLGVERAVHEQSGKDIRGNVNWFQIVATPIRNSTGRVTSALEVVIPITEHKKHLEEKACLKEQLQQSQKMEAVGTLAGGMAHDFNNLLTGILGQTEILLRKLNARDDSFDSVQVIQSAALQAAELTRQLLGFARKGKFEDRPVDVRSVVSDVMAILKHTLDKRIVLECRLEEGDSMVIGDPTQLQQVLMNLAINARDAMPDGGKLTIEARALELSEDQVQGMADASPGRYLMASVSDTGAGIPENIRGRVFEPFFTTKSSGEGTGMGLAMAYGIVQDHGGWIGLQSEAGNGTTFRLYLPLAEDQKLPAAKIPAPDLIRGEGHILVVDDEEIVRDVTVGFLAALGYEPVFACNGQEAIDYFSKNRDRVDLVLLDMIMPRMNGATCFRALRQIDPHLKILLLSGHVLSEVVYELQAEGAAGFLRKPFTLQLLSRMVAEALAGGAENPPP
jgi:signal transduction histidine kinase/CheY-like chemotaxis protein